MKSPTKRILFFVMVFAVFVAVSLGVGLLSKKVKMNNYVAVGLAAAIFTGVLALVCVLGDSSESYAYSQGPRLGSRVKMGPAPGSVPGTGPAPVPVPPGPAPGPAPQPPAPGPTPSPAPGPGECPCPSWGKVPWKPSYSTLDGVNDPTDWEITKAKKCCGGLDGGDPEWCNDPKNQALINMHCCESSGKGGCQGCKGFVGKPVYFNYTVESDALWENPRCSTPMTPNWTPPTM